MTLLGFQGDEAKVNRYSDALRAVAQITALVTTATVAMGIAFIKAGSDAEETESKFNTVFSSIQEQANNTADTLAKDFGIASITARQLLGDTGDLLTGFGFTQESALDLSKQVQELAVDLASFTNFSGGAEGASIALTKALLGERESIKSLGISILEEDVQRQIAINTANGMVFETERLAKAYATLQLAQMQSVNAIGDFERTQDSLANRMRIVQARLTDFAADIGKELIPMAKDIVEWFQNWFDANEDLIKSAIVAWIQGFVKVAVTLFLVIKRVVGIIADWVSENIKAGGALEPLIRLAQELWGFISELATVFGELFNELGIGNALLDNVSSGFDLISSAADIIITTLRILKPLIEPVLRIVLILFGVWQRVWARLQDIISEFLKFIEPIFESIIGNILEQVGGLLELLGEALKIVGIIAETLLEGPGAGFLGALSEEQLQQAIREGKLTEQEAQAELLRRQREQERQQEFGEALGNIFTIPEAPPGVVLPTTNGGVNQENNVEVNVTLPEGSTPEEQQSILRDTANTFREALSGVLRDTVSNSPGVD